MFCLLSPEERERIAATAFQILEVVGVRLTEPEAQELLRAAGARLEGERVRIPAWLVEETVRSAPRKVSVYTRDGDLAMELGGRSAHFGAHVDAPDVIDPFSGERRPCRETDVARHAALIEELSHIEFVTASGMVADRSAAVADRVALGRCLIGSRKPVLTMPMTPKALVDSTEMAALAVGGEERLRQRPTMIVYAEPVSPLVHPDASIRKVLYCADREIPLVYSPYAAMGATAPMSQTGIVAQLCAESLSGLVVHQLRRPGAPIIFGGMASVMDMKSTIFSYGAPEFQRGNTLLVEMAHHFDLPNFGTAGTSDAQVFDGQALTEAVSSCMLAYLSGANLIHDVGLLGNATVVSPSAIVATDEIIAMLAHLFRESDIRDSESILTVTEEIGPGGEFVTHEHTFKHFRDVWYPRLLFRGGAEAWAVSEQKTFERRVQERTCELVDQGQPSSLPRETVSGIEKVIVRAEERTRCHG